MSATTWFASSDMPTVKRIDPADLRTVQPVDLRTPQARVMDAEARDLRTAGDKIAELTAQVGTLQAQQARIKAQLVALEARLLARDLQQQVDALQAVCSELSRRVTALEGRG